MTLLASRIQNIRSESRLDKWELRASRYGALDFFLADTKNSMGIITPELEQKAFSSIGSTLEVPVLDFDGSITISNSRSATISDDANTSAMQSVSFTTYSWGFTMVPSAYHNNEISFQRDFSRKFLKFLYEFASTLDTACITALNTGKTQVFTDALVYTNVSDVLTATDAQESRIMADVGPMMEANDYFGGLHLIGNTGFQSLSAREKEHAKYNDEQREIQWLNKTLHFSNRVTNAVGNAATFYAVNAGSVGLLFRVEREALARRTSLTGHQWDIENLPLLNIPIGTYTYDSVGDQNAQFGAATVDNTRAMEKHYGFSVDVAVVTPYASDLTTIAAPIMAVAIQTP